MTSPYFDQISLDEITIFQTTNGSGANFTAILRSEAHGTEILVKSSVHVDTAMTIAEFQSVCAAATLDLLQQAAAIPQDHAPELLLRGNRSLDLAEQQRGYPQEWPAPSQG